MITKLDNEHLRIKTETSTLRLIASETMIKILDELEISLKNSFETSVDLIKSLAKPENLQNLNFINAMQAKLLEQGKQVQEKRDALKNQMRIELEQI